MSIFEFDKELYDRCRRREGYNEGLEDGVQQKAIEGALVLIKDFKADPKLAAEKMNAPLDKVLEALKQKEVTVQV